MTVSVDPSRLHGVTRHSTYLAMCSTQGGRTVYSTRIPLGDLDTILPLPKVDEIDPDNRKISPNHAKDFGKYVGQNPQWTSPTLMVRDAGGCTFEPLAGANDGEVGYLTVPWSTGSTRAQLSIIDGQHRILGVHTEIARLTDELARVDRELGRARAESRIDKLTKERRTLEEAFERLQNERVGVDIYVERDSNQSRQMFVDVADNAKGISAAVRSRFDSTKIVNRILDDVSRHSLFRGRVDVEQDRMKQNSPNLLGAKHLADLARGVVAGVGGRISRKQEAELNDGAVIERVNGFFDVLLEAFPPLAEVADEKLAPPELRRISLLGSVGMLRVLAGVYHELKAKNVDDEQISEFFTQLAPHMGAPVDADSIWRRDPKVNESFENGAFAPVMRTQNLIYIVRGLTSWYSNRPGFLRDAQVA